MSSPDLANLLYLGLLGAAIAGWLFLANRDSIGRKLQHAAVWGLIFLGTIAAVGLWGDIRQTVAPRQAVLAETGAIALPRAPDGHFYATLEVNGAPVRFMVDTGATGTVLTRADAALAGLPEEDLAFYSQAQTANGAVRTAPVTLDAVAFGPYEDSGVPAYVNEGEMAQSLLGMSYLRRFDRLAIEGDRMVLER